MAVVPMAARWRALAGIAALVAAAGCAHVPLDHQLREAYQLSPETLKNLQVYTSGDIILERRVERKRAEADADRKLVVQESELIRKVYIPSGTPGVIVGVENDRLHVQFEPGATLTFGSTEKNREKLGGLYNLMAHRWENGRGRVNYGGEWFLTQPGAGSVHLIIRKRDIQRTKVVQKTVRGMLATDPSLRLMSPPLNPAEREEWSRTQPSEADSGSPSGEPAGASDRNDAPGT